MPPSTKNRHIDIRKDIFAIIFLACGIFFGLCLVSYSPTDPALNSVSNVPYVKNMGGIVGAYLSDVLFMVFGISAYLSAFLLVAMSLLQFVGRPIRLRLREIFCYAGVIAFGAALIHLRFETVSLHGHSIAGGGIIGGLLGDALAHYLNRAGAYVISSAGLFLLFLIATHLSIGDVLHIARRASVWVASNVWIGVKWVALQTPPLAKKLLAWAKTLVKGLVKKSRAKLAPETLADPKVLKRMPATRERRGDVISLAPIRPATSLPQIASPPPADANNAAQEAAQPEGPRILKRADMHQRRVTDDQLKFHKMCSEGYEPPPLGLLDAPERKKIEIDEETLKKNSQVVENKVKDFDVEGHVTAIHPGPVITMYEFEPAPGTKVGKIVNLEDDLSLTLGGRSVRIVPHLPGKAALGIEVPNSEREIVWLKDTLSSQQYHKAQGHLPLALGSSTSGHAVVADLTKMPHLLVAGATGSGKSVAINSIIASIVYRASPADVRFILVDPKMLELSVYDGIPHLLLPVVTKPKPAVLAMRWALREMERRYRLMADTGTRNILGYNEKINSGQVQLVTPEEAVATVEANHEAAAHTGPIPYIVIIIDELADLMMTASQDMEDAITRLAQMARAAGIHLILATQRPSVDVITGLIKANFPARIAFKVTAKHDSRTILDANGAETLLGQGDMLFMTPQGGNLIRIHGAYITDSDITRIVAHLKAQGQPVYDESIVAEPKDAAGNPIEEGGEMDDELYDQAVKLVAETKQASISMVQRRLRIGYNRAARMIERMESEGVVGPAEGSKPRQVLAGNFET
ncbi:MAG: DNA translocase FtsK 4TM domain-containing protein [Pseudomonadota bacterium]